MKRKEASKKKMLLQKQKCRKIIINKKRATITIVTFTILYAAPRNKRSTNPSAIFDIFIFKFS
jgi:hypothetical protein